MADLGPPGAEGEEREVVRADDLESGFAEGSWGVGEEGEVVSGSEEGSDCGEWCVSKGSGGRWVGGNGTKAGCTAGSAAGVWYVVQGVCRDRGRGRWAWTAESGSEHAYHFGFGLREEVEEEAGRRGRQGDTPC